MGLFQWATVKDGLNSVIAFLKGVSQEFAITRGPKGALVYDGNNVIEIDPVKVWAMDTVGARDMLAGAFLYGLTQGWDQRQSGDLAAAASAKLVARLGPRIRAEETRAVLRRFV